MRIGAAVLPDGLDRRGQPDWFKPRLAGNQLELGPSDDLEPSIEILDYRSAAFDPVATIDVAQSEIVADYGVMDVSANDSVEGATSSSFCGERPLVLSDEGDRILDLQLGPFRERPVGQSKNASDLIEIGVDPNREIIGSAAQECEPTRVADDHVEQVPVNDKIAFAVGGDVDGVLEHLDAAEMGTVAVAQELVVIAGNVEQAHAFARLTQQLLHDVVVKLRPIPGGFQLPAVNDVADQINGVGFV